MEYQGAPASRSLGAQVATEASSRARTDELTFDFSGVESVAPSFVSELFFKLAEAGTNLKTLKFAGVADAHIQARIQSELERAMADYAEPSQKFG